MQFRDWLAIRRSMSAGILILKVLFVAVGVALEVRMVVAFAVVVVVVVVVGPRRGKNPPKKQKHNDIIQWYHKVSPLGTNNIMMIMTACPK